MSKLVAGTMLSIPLDSSSHVPLFQQLYNQIRDGILGGRIPPGRRLPSSRTLADDLAVSRTTILSAFDQLVAEGYLEGRVGSGMRVVSTLPDTTMVAMPRTLSPKQSPRDDKRLSRRSTQRWPATLPHETVRARPLWPGNPDLTAFPREIWSRLIAKHWRNVPHSLLGYGDPMGYRPLRSAIADYVTRTRGVRCDASHVLVVKGSQQALHLCSQILLDVGDVAAMEDPGYLGARAAFLSVGARVAPVEVDQEGLVVSALAKRRLRPRLVYVTPSHQCPLGMPMSLSRRLQLIDFAHRMNAWILEDDYLSEYRYFSRPLPALQSHDANGRVIYIGTVSKTLIPALRIGYVVLPDPLLDVFVRARVAMDRQPSPVDQAALAEFVSEGLLERHIRQTRVRYMERQQCLIDAIREETPDLLNVSPAGAGMYLVGYLKNGLASTIAARVAETHGVGAVPLSMFSLRPFKQDGLILGYGAYTLGQIRLAVKQLSSALREAAQSSVH
jgi:GntR family transcriptional regulator/MocR family aminotransferase